MTIDGLNALTTLTAGDELPVWDKEASGEPTKKITASNLASSVKSLASLPNTTEMNSAIAQSTAYTPITLTAGSGVTISLQDCYLYGKLLFVSMTWSAASNIPSYSTIASFKNYTSKMAWSAPLTTAATVVVANNGLYADKSNSMIRASTVIPAGTYKTFLIIPIN